MMELSTDVVQVIHDYELPGKGFLPIKRNELLSVIERDPTGWWLGCNVRGRKGVFPSTYCIPYMIKAPLEDTEKEYNLLRKAEHLNLNLLCPTISPINVERERICLPQASQWSSENAIANHLVELLHKKETLKSSITSTTTELSVFEDGGRTEEVTIASTPAVVAPSHGADQNSLSSEMESLYRTIINTKTEYVKAFQIPQLSWYKHLADFTLESHMDPLVVQLEDVRSALKLKEASIAKTLKQLTDEEHSYVTKRDQVSARINQRDALVIALLEDWASSAQAAKTKYTVSKEELLRMTTMEERITACQRDVELYADKYTRNVEHLHVLEDSIQFIKTQLSRKQRLIDIDRQIKSINEQLAAA
ncbi:hypothetical protein STCU_07951 [Strigomonas culicis]|uniref:SH3 domain-containing protein n=1 Tax=Strigomonas culicis TaxID=28005 RepID=S9TXX5_9TRYP|nr:hypothetical protein STCU_08516 [Strigomonas culicis]EPY23007.1 hypothetical protein STCU_07951 [Strigomonas culicis]|eukprot:EPY21493.1 hypothetical protein STCU_08516 [Strigomonas culicis]